MGAHDDPRDPRASARAMIATHMEACELCATWPLPIEPLAAVLHASTIDIDGAQLSRQTLLQLQPELARRAATSRAAEWWRQVAVALLLALLPLPLVLAYDAYLLQLLYAAIQVLVPASLATFVVASYGALLVLLFAGTYAAIPLLLARGQRWQPAAPG